MVLPDELVLERGWDEDARGEIFGLEDGKAIDGDQRVGVQGLEEGGRVLLRVLPFFEGGGQIGVNGVGERREKGGGAEQNLRVDAMKKVEVGNVADDPDLIAV